MCNWNSKPLHLVWRYSKLIPCLLPLSAIFKYSAIIIATQALRVLFLQSHAWNSSLWKLTLDQLELKTAGANSSGSTQTCHPKLSVMFRWHFWLKTASVEAAVISICQMWAKKRTTAAVFPVRLLCVFPSGQRLPAVCTQHRQLKL